jgi:multiple sugar transport system substrate-binding protein
MPYFAPKEQEGEALSLSEEEALIDKGLAAMWPEFYVLWWYRKMQGNVGVAPFPVESPDSRTTPAWTNDLAMSAGTQQPDAAWRWMVFLSSKSLRGVGQGTQYLPARRSTAETPGGYWDELDEELVDALRYAVDHGYITDGPVGYDAFNEAYDAVMAEEKTAKVAMDDAQARVRSETEQRLLEAADATPAPTVMVVASKEPEATGAEVVISFVPGLGSFNLEPYRRLAKRFQEENPDIAVDVKMLDITGAGGGAPSLASLARSADCFQWFPSLQDPKSLEAILSLDPFLEADDTFDLDDYYPQLTKQFTEQGQVWALPADVTPFIIEYNRDLFDAAGVAYPTVDWTWEDFLETAVALTQGEGETKQYGYVAEMYESSDLMLMLERLGGRLVDSEADPPVFTLDDPSVVEALGWYASLHTEYKVKPAFITDISKLMGASAAYLEREGLINGGRAAMWTSSATTAAVMGPRENLNIGVAPVPGRADGTSRASILTTSGYFISAETEERLACWKWIIFLSREAEAVQGFPARRSLAESDVYRERVGEERAAAYMSSVADAAEPSSLDVLDDEEWMGGALFWVFQAYGKVLEGEMSAEEALAEAQELAEEYQACLAVGGDYSGEAWRACLKKVDPSLPDFILAQVG